MHLLPVQSHSLDAEAQAVDLAHTPADLLLMSFSDADLAVAAAAWEADRAALPSLRLIKLGRLAHPFSVDLLVEKLASRAKFVVVRLLGGADYWRYGVDELAAAARRYGFHLAVLPGDDRADNRLVEASTVSPDDLEKLHAYFQAGGISNFGNGLRWMACQTGVALAVSRPCPVPLAGLYPAACQPGPPGAPHALILFYRSALLAGDLAPVHALSSTLFARGARVTACHVMSLKDPASVAVLTSWLARERPDVIITTTAFSAADRDGSVLDLADCPVLQAVLSGSDRDSWAASSRGLRAADLAMNVVLPEVDGRISAGILSFKAESEQRADLEYTTLVHRPDPERTNHIADLALAWAKLRQTPRADRRLACVLSDYPGKDGRGGYAVGLDTPASVLAIADHLRGQGFDIGPLPDAAPLMERLSEGATEPVLSLADYRRLLVDLPAEFVRQVADAWGDPADDDSCHDGAFHLRFLRTGKLVLAIQPDRGSSATRRADYHDGARPPRHCYVAFYLWLRLVERCHAMIHLGTHGTLEWLPGKSVALSQDCAPAVLTGSMPVVYPFIVNNPGEAAQAKRRIGAVIVGHLTPPLVEAGTHGDTADLEQLFDEYAEALALDGRRAKILARAILEKADDRGLMPDGVDKSDPDGALATLDAWLCDLKEARIGDGLHVFGRAPDEERLRTTVASMEAELSRDLTPDLAACGPAELGGLTAALDGRFVRPGPSGAPARGRLDVLPTGRNLFSTDPRAVPTRTAWEIGRRMADDLVTRYAQDQGEWPRRVVLDLWGSATMRTGGDDLAQAFALIGARPRWDNTTTRINGFDITPLAKLGRSRVDVTLRISGLFRDTFPDQIALFDAAVRAIAALDEENADNPLAEARRAGSDGSRVFGAAQGSYGLGLAGQLSADPDTKRETLAQTYLAASATAYGPGDRAYHAAEAFKERVVGADAFSHTGDLPGQDLLDSDTSAEHEGGFAAAAATLGGRPALYRADTSRPDRPQLRTLKDEISRAVVARAANPRWIAGQMRHGHRGAIAMAETLDALYAFAATTDAVPSRHFDRYFDATLGDDEVRDFLEQNNRPAARAMAKKFEAALRNGYWTSRRNSTSAILAGVQDRPSAEMLHS